MSRTEVAAPPAESGKPHAQLNVRLGNIGLKKSRVRFRINGQNGWVDVFHFDHHLGANQRRTAIAELEKTLRDPENYYEFFHKGDSHHSSARHQDVVGLLLRKIQARAPFTALDLFAELSGVSTSWIDIILSRLVAEGS